MKKYLALILAVIMAFSVSFGVIADETEASSNGAPDEMKTEISALTEVSAASAENTEAAKAGDSGWTLPDTIDMTSTATEVFNKAMEGLVGVNYEPLGYLGKKDGTYCILCRATVVYPGAEPFYTLVYVNDAGVQNIWDIWMDKHANP